MEATTFKVYPNPAERYFVVDIDNDEATQLMVLNMLGNIVINKTIHKGKLINTSDWSKGIYLVRCGNTTKKIILQ